MEKILANKVYSDSTLKKWTKEEFIEQIRILEHNWSCAEETLNNSVKNGDKIFAELKRELAEHEEFTQKANAEIERLTEAMSDFRQEVITLNIEKLELQKQVDELKEKIMKLKSAMISRVAMKSYDSMLTIPDDVEEIFGDAYESEFNGHLEQAVKDTAKEILQWLIEHTFESCIIETYFKERYGVEVK